MQTSAEELLEALPSRWGPEWVREMRFDGAVSVELTGDRPATYAVSCRGDELEVVRGPATDPVATITVDRDAFVRLCHARHLPEDKTRRLAMHGSEVTLEKLHQLLIVPSADEFFRTAAEEAARRPPLREVERVRGTYARIRDADRQGVPIVLVDALADWEPSGWTLDTVKERFGELKLVFFAAGAAPLFETVAKYVELLQGSEGDAALPAFTGREPPPPVREALGFPPVLAPQARDQRPELFFSAAGRVTRLHRDSTAGVLVTVFGRRRVRLYSPDQGPPLYAFPSFGSYQICCADPEAPDLERHPRFADARPLDVLLEPGEILLIPFGWFHHVVVVDHALAIRYNIREEPRER